MIVEYRHGGWNRVHLPERGSHSAWADGLLNILDANGRCVEAKDDVATVWYDEEAFFKERPECAEDHAPYGGPAGVRPSPKVEVYFPDLNQRMSALGEPGTEDYREILERLLQKRAEMVARRQKLDEAAAAREALAALMEQDARR